MRNVILFILACQLLFSCKVYDESMLKAVRDPIEPKLPALQMIYGNFNNTVMYGDPCSCELNMMSDEVEYNLTDFYGEQYGYISFQVQQVDYAVSNGWLLPTAFSLGLLNVLGMPSVRYMREIELQVSIIDSNRQLLKKYASHGKTKIWVACYYGYRDKYARMLLYPNSMNKALAEIRSQIREDATFLRDKLLEAGPIE